jgi:ankyrin repeat protein
MLVTKVEQSLLFAAIGSDRCLVIGVMLDASADMNLAAYSSHLQTNITPLAYAIHFKTINAVAFLISRGANLQPVQEWPIRSAIYDILRTKWMALKGSPMPEYKVLKDLSDEDLAKF